MKHIRGVTVAKALLEAEDIRGILDQVFGFVLELVELKGKGASESDS